MIGVNVIKIILPFASSWLYEYGFSALTEIQSKKRKILRIDDKMRVYAWQRQNIVSILFVHKNRQTHSINFLKQLCFVVSVPRIFYFYFPSALQAEKV